MITLEGMIRDIRTANPKRDRSHITDFGGMHDFLKFIDLPDNFADLLRCLWPVIQVKSKELQGRLSKPGQSIEAYHELIIGYSLFEHCRINSLELEYSPTIRKQTPDWVIHGRDHKVVIEVVTVHKSVSHSTLDACISLINILVERGLNSKAIDAPISYNTSKFRIPDLGRNISTVERENSLTEYSYKASVRIIQGVEHNHENKEKFCDESGLEINFDLGHSSRMTTRGYETYRVINSILDKGEKYSGLSQEIPVIVAVANSHQNRSKAYSPSEIAQLLYYPDSVYEHQFCMITDKEKHIKNIQDRKEDLNALEGILFYNFEVSNICTTCYEYYPNLHKATKWEIPDRFKAYLEGGSNECK